MILNNRQTAILYELIKKDTFLSYQYLCSKFFVSEKTVRTDIKQLNDFLLKDDISISLRKGKGFFLNCTEKKKIDLIKNFDYRYKDSSEIISKHSKKDLTIYSMLIKGPVKVEEISKRLNINKKSISVLLKDVRNTLKQFNVNLMSKPRIGLYLDGEEANIRTAIIDQVNFMVSNTIDDLFLDVSKVFDVSRKELEILSNLFENLIKKYHIEVAQVCFIKVIVAMVISDIRYKNGYNIHFDKNQISLIKSFIYYKEYNQLFESVNNHYNIQIDENEKMFITAYAFAISNFSDVSLKNAIPGVYDKKAHKISQILIQDLDDYCICKEYKDSLIKDTLYEIALEALVRKNLNIIDSEFNNIFRIIVSNCALCTSIGLLLSKHLNELLDFNFGEYMQIRISLAIYENIRYVTRTKSLSRIALFTPYYSNHCNSIVDRIKYHCSNFIESIDVLCLSDVLNADMKKYDLVLYFEDYELNSLDNDINKMKISYFFDNKDLETLYRELSVMTRFYKNTFGSLKRENIIEDKITFKDIDDLMMYGRKLCKNDSNLKKQLKIIPFSSLLINNNSFSIVLFTDKDELRTTKLIKFDKPLIYNGQKIATAIISIINSERNIAALKTSESIIRLITDSVDTNRFEDFENADDLYDYFLHEYKH